MTTALAAIVRIVHTIVERDFVIVHVIMRKVKAKCAIKLNKDGR